MKKFLEGVLAWKSAAAMMFSASVVLCALIMLFMGTYAVPIPVLASLLIISMGGTFLQFLILSDTIIKHMRYTIRMAIFKTSFLALLAANAYFFRWFPLEGAMYWLLFIGIALIVFVGGTVAFEIYFHIMGKKYDGLLGQYRKQKEETPHQS
ncbi:MAG: hypothetical protein FWD84_02210 [Oscillospiraceae bacterium]|nr:hypothetical protein [Oscillospiraceae bacterium]